MPGQLLHEGLELCGAAHVHPLALTGGSWHRSPHMMTSSPPKGSFSLYVISRRRTSSCAMSSRDIMLTSSMITAHAFWKTVRSVFFSESIMFAMPFRFSLKAACTVVPPFATAAFLVLAQTMNALYWLGLQYRLYTSMMSCSTKVLPQPAGSVKKTEQFRVWRGHSVYDLSHELMLFRVGPAHLGLHSTRPLRLRTFALRHRNSCWPRHTRTRDREGCRRLDRAGSRSCLRNRLRSS